MKDNMSKLLKRDATLQDLQQRTGMYAAGSRVVYTSVTVAYYSTSMEWKVGLYAVQLTCDLVSGEGSMPRG